jgi:hypothetical protein
MIVSAYNLTVGEVVTFSNWSGTISEVTRYKNSMLFTIELLDGEEERFKRATTNGHKLNINGNLVGHFMTDNLAKWTVE